MPYRNAKGKESFLRYPKEISFWQKQLPLPWSLWPAETRLLLSLLGFWSLAGLLVLGSASWWVAAREMSDGSYYIKRQILWLLSSWSLLFLVISTSLRRWLKLAGTGVIIGCVLVGATLLIGSTVNGASRWLILGPIQIQPSEIIKPFVVLQAASTFAHWKRISSDQKLLWLGVFATLLLLILKQPNLSTAGLIGILIWLIALASGVRLRSLFSTAIAGSLLGTASIFLNEYQRLRVTSFLDPWQDPQGTGYQLIQSLLAIGSGGWFGEGYGLSTQKLQYLPIQSTDFIFAVFAEEFGFIGSLMLLFFLLLIAFLGLRVALRCRNNQAKLVAIGSTTILVGQSIMNIAVASGAMPTTGLPLPLVSYGGNSLISSLFLAGLLIRCSLESTGFLPDRRPNKVQKSIR
ncbi:putative peptidoglycan glycosyltransferase FtsW [Prochlorococcus sp. MIT 1341]|uniref:FtsW/RodA/SpoVE family cell cycle protein n=1 Tax=Prochlorococcus sp. MIT 1341 TaxID=3096221 RepID=UPI002A758BCD|nr:putative peptidoglycan glycosyltransferase FtsW [Prochlorococcus sp. MIT 1341]